MNQTADRDSEPSKLKEYFGAELYTCVVAAERARGRPVSREDLAKRAHVSIQSIYAYLRGVTLPRADVLERLFSALGVPGSERGRLASLRDAADTAQRASGRRSGAAASPRPSRAPDTLRGIPSAAPCFVGRTEQLRLLHQLNGSRVTDLTLQIIVVHGPPGVGKTALALHWAHQVLDQFPDGQLFFNLEGFSASAAPKPPGSLIREVLDALNVPADRIPVTVDGQAMLLRTILADRRLLIVLDNAFDAAQIRHVIPGSSPSTILITSRNNLAGLVASHGAHAIEVERLNAEESAGLFACRLRRGGRRAETKVAAMIAHRCAGLPLALVIAAARAVMKPGFPLAALKDQLDAQEPRLGALVTGADPATNLRSVFSWSYRHLSTEAARMFRRAGLTPAREFSLAALTVLAGLTAECAQVISAELTSAHLMEECVPGRFSLHDLLKDYALELTMTGDTPEERRSAKEALLNYYAFSTDAAARAVEPQRIPPALLSPVANAETFDGSAAAFRWLELERSALIAVTLEAAEGDEPVAGHLAWALGDFLDRTCRWREWLAIQKAVLTSTIRRNETDNQARAHRAVGLAYCRLGETRAARLHLELAADLAAAANDSIGQARATNILQEVAEKDGDIAEALRRACEARELYQAANELVWEARSLNAIGWYLSLLDEHVPALDHCERALSRLSELGDAYGQGSTWDSLGHIYLQLGDNDRAADCYRRSLAIRRTLHDRHGEAVTLIRLGDSQVTNDKNAARRSWQLALTILDDLNHVDADSASQRLLDLTTT